MKNENYDDNRNIECRNRQSGYEKGFEQLVNGLPAVARFHRDLRIVDALEDPLELRTLVREFLLLQDSSVFVHHRRVARAQMHIQTHVCGHAFSTPPIQWFGRWSLKRRIQHAIKLQESEKVKALFNY